MNTRRTITRDATILAAFVALPCLLPTAAQAHPAPEPAVSSASVPVGQVGKLIARQRSMLEHDQGLEAARSAGGQRLGYSGPGSDGGDGHGAADWGLVFTGLTGLALGSGATVAAQRFGRGRRASSAIA